MGLKKKLTNLNKKSVINYNSKNVLAKKILNWEPKFLLKMA